MWGTMRAMSTMASPETSADVDTSSSRATAESAATIDTHLRILDAFVDRARSIGIRAVVMAELAHDLGISTKTLYRHYRSKDELLIAMLDRWQAVVAEFQQENWRTSSDPTERLVTGALGIINSRRSFCDQFWVDLDTSYPVAAAHLKTTMLDARARTAEWLVPLVREELSIELLGPMFDSVIAMAAGLAAKAPAGVDRDDVISQVVRIWARGALKTEVIS